MSIDSDSVRPMNIADWFADSQTTEFRNSLLIAFFMRDMEPMSLTEAMKLAASLVDGRYEHPCTLGYPSQKKAKYDLVAGGYLTQRKRGRSYELSITEKGEELARELADREPLGGRKTTMAELGEPPYRVGAGHLLGREQWRGLMDAMRAGDVELLVVKPGTAAKVKFWDERGES